MNLLKHAQRTVKEELCPSGSFEQFSGSIAALNDHINKRFFNEKVPYHWYLNHAAWALRRQLYEEYYGKVCQVCHKPKLVLQLDHVTGYGMKVGRESLTDLVWCCKGCHNQRHNTEHMRNLGLEV